VAQPVFAAWGTRDTYIPVRASAAALRDALAAGPNRDRTFRSFDATHAGAAVYRRGDPVFAPGFLEESSRWLGTRLGATKATPRVSTPLPPADGGPQPVDVAKASFATAPATQAIWLVLPALLLALGALAARRRATPQPPATAAAAHPGRLIAAVAVADAAALAAIAAGVADALSSGGRGVAHVAGIPWLFALAFVLAAVGLLLTIGLARARIWLAVAGSAAWLGLALFWLL
jgi:hypothetical protein